MRNTQLRPRVLASSVTHGSLQGMVATDEHLSVSQMTASRAVRVVAPAIVECLGSRWINFHAKSKAATKEGFARADGMLAGVVGMSWEHTRNPPRPVLNPELSPATAVPEDTRRTPPTRTPTTTGTMFVETCFENPL
ncbi:hypothetical protein HPB47_021109 [Ixodes persulcatus]|uniref:Uncharacterized protein n=1 Tax=Ixodes persulcatus TaxID=34615 RepID=A0AC60QGS3_IXOPE|nr:hypothetical protein HPB47_021109 [Ixodes persulcatus]